MNKEKDFFKTCFNTVAGLEVKNESQAIAKEVVLSEIENLHEQNKKQKEVIDKALNTLERGITFCENDSQGVYEKCNIAINREKEVLNILKEVIK